ncbi:hypothetical protein APSETT444_007861 [Aspergillus pseudonomiae]
MKDNSIFTVTARREVILSAGTFNSPKILELSGIGSRTILESFDIPVIIDNPNVGENLQDHPLAGLSFEVQDFIKTKDDLMRRVPEALSAAMESYKTHHLMHPLSRGSCHISSSNPSDYPIVDPRYLTHPADLEMLARHARFIDVIAASQPLASMLKPGGKRSLGSPDDLRKIPLDDVKEYVKCAGKSTFYLTSTCAMMPREKGGVVDSRLRVWGAKGLRIVDASVIPIIPRGNTQSTVYAIAERAADLIREDLAGK